MASEVTVKHPAYTLQMMKKLPDVDDLSSLTYVPEENILVVTLNKPATLLKLTTDGEVISRHDLPFIKDAETVEYIGHGKLAMVDERDSVLHIVNLSDLQPSQPVSAIDLKFITPEYNRGFEGMAWAPDQNTLYVAKERSPYGLYSVKWDENNHITGIYKVNDLLEDINVNDISALNYDHGNLFVLSDQSKGLLQITPEGKVTAVLNLTAGHHGLKKDVPQAEGVASDAQGNIYVASEPNLFYKFVPVSQAAGQKQ
ncbi:hypothetical protein F9C28_18445 [Shimwellia pseudoproteus]|uniref:SdiA-regulated domain-containing protein n=1 Tax=Shimwellia pseudoproteus TaxID=570012 RepID=UPI0018EAE9F3|nr:SdiA-regulated domain-containing protein [Shimwellia pseudoproteus]MBJ3816828.1 hypothetical protein [Shimwellia pseudoproteus]